MTLIKLLIEIAGLTRQVLEILLMIWPYVPLTS